MATVTDVLPTGDALPEHYEVVNGVVLELPPMSDYAREVANRLNRAVTRHLAANDVGGCGVELRFRIPQPGDRSRNRQPDMAFVSYDRWPRDHPLPYTGNARDVVPDLAVEVVSPGDAADDLVAKAREYLRGGVRLVWVVYPLAQEVHAYLPSARQVRVYAAGEDLEAPDVLPGFAVPVAGLFPPLAEAPGTARDDEP